ncbi:hypothetical protein LIER_24107 [Lithospermum erythrorhizon]|uniref:Jacalin-type lectin domain-containing protein n=1 Tax=Lithospermum erythrorhizon TaxID=34254 RepID=A0AAV3R245_LITER
MDTSSLIKLALPYEKRGHQSWDDRGRANIAKIFVTYNKKFNIQAIQFVYVENGNYVLSEKHGKNADSDNFAVLGDGSLFAGFHGTFHCFTGDMGSIGVYINPMYDTSKNKVTSK